MPEQMRDDVGPYILLKCRCYYTDKGKLQAYNEDCNTHRVESYLYGMLRSVRKALFALPQDI